MRALVTGSAGFLGRHFSSALDARGWTVTQVDLRGWERRDCLDVFGYDTTRYDLVVHAAAESPHRSAIDNEPVTLVRNQLLDAAMFDWASRTRQHRILYLSSCAAADEQPDGYGMLKLTGERMAAQCGVPVTIVRPYSGYGEDQDERFPFGAFAARARRKDDPFIIWGDGLQVRDWIYVDDVVAGSLALVDAEVAGPVSICTGIGTPMRDLAEMMCERAGYWPEIELQLEKPAGTHYRVGDSTRLRQVYLPKVSIGEGVARALC